MKKLLLFDIDGTLISGGGAGRKALDRAFLTLYGRPNASEGFTFDGKTDRAIVREMLPTLTGNSLQQIDESDVISRTEEILTSYLAYLPDEVARATNYRILPGIVDLLEMLQRDARFYLGLATGNLRKGAEIKLNHGNLYHYFSFGGFGCDAEKRPDIVARAIANAKTFSGTDFADGSIYLIGDTHHDVEAGKILGLKTVAVATGSYSEKDLANSKPSFIFKNFSNAQRFYNFFSQESAPID